MLAFTSGEASKERPQRGDSGIDSSLEAGLLAERFQRRQLVRAGSAPVQVSYPAGIPQGQVGGLVVFMRAAQTKWRDRGHDQTRVEFLQARVVQPSARHLSRMVVVDQYIRVFEQALKDLLSGRLAQVEGDPVFVGVQVEEQRALLRVRDVARLGAT